LTKLQKVSTVETFAVVADAEEIDKTMIIPEEGLDEDALMLKIDKVRIWESWVGWE